MAGVNDDFGETIAGQRKLDQLFRRLETLPLEEEILTIDKDQAGKAIELHNHQVLARWTFSGKTLLFSDGEKEAIGAFETDSMDAAFEHTRVFLRSIKRRNAGRPSGELP